MVSRKLLVLMLVACLALTVMSVGSPAAADSAAKVTLKIYDQPQDDDTDAAKESWERYKGEVEKKFPDVEFVWTRLAPGTDYRQQYDQLLMAGDGPTVTHQFPYVDVQTRLRDGTIADITEYVENWDLKQQGLVLDTFDQAISLDGKWFAVPWGPYISGTAVNKGVIAEAGGDPSYIPTTWTEFAESAKALTDKSVPRFGYLLLGSDYNAWTFTPWVWSAGGEMVRPNGDGTWAVAFNEEAGVDAAMFLNSLVNDYECTQLDVLESYGDMQNHFIAGQAVYGWGAPTWFSKDDLAKYDQTQDSLGFFPMPAKDEGGVNVAFAGGEVWTMSPLASKEQMDAAWAYIQFVSYDPDYLIPTWEFENSLGRLDDRSACRTDLIEKKYSLATNWPEGWAEQFSAMMKVAKPEPYCPNWNQLKDEIVKPLQTIYLKKGITRDEVKQLLDECAETLYTKYPESFKKPAA